MRTLHAKQNVIKLKLDELFLKKLDGWGLTKFASSAATSLKKRNQKALKNHYTEN